MWQALQPTATQHIIYFGDTIHVPYGDKTPDELFGYLSEDHGVFVQRQVSAVVMACNTMSAVVMPRIKEPPVPLINIIDAAVTQALTVTKGRIRVLATRATTESRLPSGIPWGGSQRGSGGPGLSRLCPSSKQGIARAPSSNKR